MTVFEALCLMLEFGMFIIALITLVITIIKTVTKK